MISGGSFDREGTENDVEMGENAMEWKWSESGDPWIG